MEKLVQRGAERLDRHDPDWWRSIKLKKLDLGSENNCVLGQLFGSYWDGLKRLDISGTSYGFDGIDDEALTKLWKKEILDRKFA